MDQLNARREADQSKVDEFVEQIQELKIPVLSVDADRPELKAFQEICFLLKPFLNKREEHIESKLTSAIPEEQVKLYEKSWVYKKSRFDNSSPHDLYTKKREFCVLYRDRIYYAASQEEQEKIMRHPL